MRFALLIVPLAASGLLLGACDTGTENGTAEASQSAEPVDEPTGTTLSTADAADAGTASATSGTDGEAGSGEGGDGELYPDVVGVEATRDGDGTWTFAVTLSSPYDSPERYADAWRVRNTDGTVYGERILTHDHAGEQPFTRSQSGIAIPDDVTEVVVEGRDQVGGWGGGTMTYTLPT